MDALPFATPYHNGVFAAREALKRLCLCHKGCYSQALNMETGWAFYMLRAMGLDDIPQSVTIEALTQPTPWSARVFELCLSAGGRGYVVEQQGVLVGFILLLCQAQESHILNLAVHPDYQRRGLGAQLLRKAVEASIALGADWVTLEVRVSNLAAIHLYRSSGFREVGMRRGYYSAPNGNEDALLFALTLADNYNNEP